MDKKIGKLIKVVKALTQLAPEVGTLITVIKMVIESINWKMGRKTSPYIKDIIVCLQNQHDKEHFKTISGGYLAGYRSSWFNFTVYVKS